MRGRSVTHTSPPKSLWIVQEHDSDDHSLLREFATLASALRAATDAVTRPRPNVARVEVWKKTIRWRRIIRAPSNTV